jgi:hypothetical protein
LFVLIDQLLPLAVKIAFAIPLKDGWNVQYYFGVVALSLFLGKGLIS